MKYGKYNIQQNKQIKEEEETKLYFQVEGCKFTLEISHSFSPQIWLKQKHFKLSHTFL